MYNHAVSLLFIIGIIIILFYQTGCHLYAGATVHDTAFDSQFNQDNLITTFGVSQELNNNFDLYVEHSSLTLKADTIDTNGGGHGLNQAGIRAKIKIF